VDFYGEKLAKVTHTVLSTRNVMWASTMPKMRCRRGSAPDPVLGAHDAPQIQSVGEGTPPPQSQPILTPSELSFYARNVKSRLRPCVSGLE